MKAFRSTEEQQLILQDWSAGGESGTSGGAVKCVDIRRNAGGESDSLAVTDAECAKARGANGIRYPGSPSRKRWELSRGVLIISLPELTH